MHTIATKTELLETTYNYKGINVSVIDRVKKNIHTGEIIKTVTHYECNCSIFYKLSDVEQFIEEVFFSGDDAITSTDKIDQGNTKILNTEYPKEYKRSCIETDAEKEGLDVSFINKNSVDLAVYREQGKYNVLYVSPLNEIFNKILSNRL